MLTGAVGCCSGTLAIDALDKLEIVRLQTFLTRSDVEARFQNRIDRFIKLFASLFALVVFEVELASAEVIFRTRHDCVKCDLRTAQLQLGLFVQMKRLESELQQLPPKRRAPLVKPHRPSDEESSLRSKSSLLLNCAVSNGSLYDLDCELAEAEPNHIGGYHTVFWGVKQTPQLKHTLKQ